MAPYIDGMIVEDIHMMIDFENDTYKRVPPRDQEFKVEVLKKMMKDHKLNVFNIDYVSQKDRDIIREVTRDSKALGFKPYVAEKNLSSIYINKEIGL